MALRSAAFPPSLLPLRRDSVRSNARSVIRQIRAAEPRKQKHDRRDAALLLKLPVENRFPAIWMPSTELRDLRTLLLHRHQWVRMRTRVQNALQAIALGHGLRRGKTLWSQLGQHTITSLPLAPHAAHRRTELLALYGKLQAQIDELDERVRDHAQQRSGAKLLMTTREWGRSRRWPRTCSWVTQRGSKTAKRW